MANTTWNPSDKATQIVLSNGNLTAGASAAVVAGVRSIDRQVYGKYYWECTWTTISNGNEGVGIASGTQSLSAAASAAGQQCMMAQAGTIYLNGVVAVNSFGTVTSGTIVCIAVDCTNSLIWFRLGAAGNWNGNAAYSPGGGGGVAMQSALGGLALYAKATLAATASSVTANFGDSAFTGAVPSGFTAGFPNSSPPNQAEATQIALEQWARGTPQAQLTQMAVEHWAAVGVTPSQVALTQIAIEQWASVTLASAQAAQARAMIMA